MTGPQRTPRVAMAFALGAALAGSWVYIASFEADTPEDRAAASRPRASTPGETSPHVRAAERVEAPPMQRLSTERSTSDVDRDLPTTPRLANDLQPLSSPADQIVPEISSAAIAARPSSLSSGQVVPQPSSTAVAPYPTSVPAGQIVPEITSAAIASRPISISDAQVAPAGSTGAVSSPAPDQVRPER